MASDLRNKANSIFLAASTFTRPRKSKPKIYVYVEDDLDKTFWRSQLNCLAKDYQLTLLIYQVKDVEIRGKDAMVKAAYEHRLSVGGRVLICIDADYDLLIDNYHPYTTFLRKCPYIITTEWYSMENLKCHPSKITEYYDKMTLKGEITIDFAKSLRQVSILYWQLLLMLLVSISLRDCYYEICHFGDDLKLIRFKDDGTIDEGVVAAVNAHVARHNAYLAAHQSDIKTMETKLSDLGYDKENCWQIMRGHDVAEIIVLRQLLATAGPYIEARQRKIGKMNASKQYKQNLCNQYKKEIGINCQSIDARIIQLINDCTNLKELDVCERIQNKVQSAVVRGGVADIIGGLLVSHTNSSMA